MSHTISRIALTILRSVCLLAVWAGPDVKNTAWAKNDIDRFVLARQEAASVSPSAEAARETLARRVFFDLIGLPPTPEELQQFLADTSADLEKGASHQK